MISFRDIRDFQSLKSFLLRRYTERRGITDLFDDLHECVRGTDEGVRSFLHRFDDIYRELTHCFQNHDSIPSCQADAIRFLTYNVKHTTISFYLSSNRNLPYDDLMLNAEIIARDESTFRAMRSRMNKPPVVNQRIQFRVFRPISSGDYATTADEKVTQVTGVPWSQMCYKKVEIFHLHRVRTTLIRSFIVEMIVSMITYFRF